MNGFVKMKKKLIWSRLRTTLGSKLRPEAGRLCVKRHISKGEQLKIEKQKT